MQPYTFPFSTCEKVSDGMVAQPVSTTINLVTCVVLFVVLLSPGRGRGSVETYLFILSLILFELWHAFSHTRHILGMTHTYVIHGLTYLIAASTAAIIHSKHNVVHLQLVGIAIVIDVVVGLMRLRKWSVITGVAVVIAVLVGNYRLLPVHMMSLSPVLATLAVAGVAAFLFEASHCSNTMATLPLHAFVEVIVMAFVVIFAGSMVL